MICMIIWCFERILEAASNTLIIFVVHTDWQPQPFTLLEASLLFVDRLTTKRCGFTFLCGRFIGKSQHRFNKGKLGLTNLIAFNDETVCSLDYKRAVNLLL